MTPTITYVNGATLPRVPHRWLAGDGPCHDCGAAVGEIHRVVGCYFEECPQCRNLWSFCRCKTVDVIRGHGMYLWVPTHRRWHLGTVEEHEDGNGRTFEMRVQEDEE